MEGTKKEFCFTDALSLSLSLSLSHLYFPECICSYLPFTFTIHLYCTLLYESGNDIHKLQAYSPILVLDMLKIPRMFVEYDNKIFFKPNTEKNKKKQQKTTTTTTTTTKKKKNKKKKKKKKKKNNNNNNNNNKKNKQQKHKFGYLYHLYDQFHNKSC